MEQFGIRTVPLVKSNMLIGADGFFHYRATEYILDTGFIRAFDDLSFGGREHIYAPGFHLFIFSVTEAIQYPLHRFVLYSSLIFYFFSFLAAIVYARKLKTSPLLTTIFLTTIPVYVWRTTSNFLAEAQWAFLLFTLILCFSNKIHTLIISAALAATHSISLIIFPIFLILHRDDKKMLAALWLLLLFAASFWVKVNSPYQNVPSELRSEIFERLDPIKYVQRSGLQGLLLVPTFPALELFGLMWLATNFGFVVVGLLELDRAIGASALIISGLASRFVNKLLPVFQLLITLTCFVWAFHQLSALDWAYVPSDTLTGLFWLNENTPADAVIASPIGEGYWVAGIASRRNIVDGNFAGINDIDDRLADVRAIYNSPAPLSKYRSRYVLATLNAKYLYNFTGYSSNDMVTVFDREGASIYSPA